VTARSCAIVREETAAGRLLATDTVDAAIARAREVGAGRDGLNVFVWRDDDGAKSQAASITDRLADTKPGAASADEDNATASGKRSGMWDPSS